MPADSTTSAPNDPSFLEASGKSSVEQQAISALNHLSPEDKTKALKYIESLVTLEKIKNDQTSATENWAIR